MIIALIVGIILCFTVTLLPILYYRREMIDLFISNDADELLIKKSKILRTYLREEKYYREKSLDENEWQKRKTFLEACYVDCVQRLSLLKGDSPGDPS